MAPLYELKCATCNTYFELAIKAKVDVSTLICPDCGAPDVVKTKVDNDRSTRIDNLIQDVGTLTGRVAKLDEFFKELTGEGGNDDTGLINLIDTPDDGTRH